MSWAGAGKRGAADEDADADAPGPDGVLATPGVREPAPQTRVAEVPLGPDDNAVAVSACGRYIAVDTRACVNLAPPPRVSPPPAAGSRVFFSPVWVSDRQRSR